MKTKILIFALFALSLVSCQKDIEIANFALDKSELLVGPERSVEQVKVISPDQMWVAETSASWITVSPANGNGAVECEFIINTTQQSNSREANVRFSNSETGEVKYVKVTQGGFAKEITVDRNEVALDNYAAFGERYFDISVTTNVDFDIKVEGENSSWIVIPSDFKVDLDRGYTPKKLNLRVGWKVNSVPFDRAATISFVPKDESEELVNNDIVSVTQTAGDIIEPTPAGDSLALLAVARSLNCIPWPAERLMMWDGVELWEEGEEGTTPENAGRVKSVIFFLSETNEDLPYELCYLTAAETIKVRSNGNSHLKSLGIGNFWGKLTNLKNLEVTAYGIDVLDESLLELGGTLQTLNISTNNFKKVPTMLTEANFPALRELKISASQIKYYLDLSNISEAIGTIGLEQNISELKDFFKWEALTSLSLGVNYIDGVIPDMLDYNKVYTQEIVNQADTLPQYLVGKPLVLPNVKELRLNLNRLTGRVPDWILYHPNLTHWDPDILIFTQEGRTRDGVPAGFDNAPENYDYYYDIYTYLANKYNK